MYVATVLYTIAFLFLWDLLGQLGFSIWNKKAIGVKIRGYKPKIPVEIIESIAITFRHRFKFRLAGLGGLIYALKYKG